MRHGVTTSNILLMIPSSGYDGAKRVIYVHDDPFGTVRITRNVMATFVMK